MDRKSLQNVLLITYIYSIGAALCWDTSTPSAPVGAARLIKVPLMRGTTMNAGTLGQPVISYYASISLGTPAKVFNIQLDVGLSESFVPHYEWSPFKHNLHYGTGFQCKVSSTCKKVDMPVQIEYQNCKLTGKQYEDYLKINEAKTDTHGYSVRLRHSFLAMSDASDGRFKDLPVDGYFGLSPSSSSGTRINLVAALHDAGFIDNLQFSFWLNPVLDSPIGGELTIGGVDVNRYSGKIFWHPISATGRDWTIGLQYISLGHQVVSSCQSTGPQKCQAGISSAVNEVLGPLSDVQRIYGLLNTTRQPATGLELVDCRRLNQMPILTFVIDGVPYALLPSNYVRKTTNGTIFKTETCYVAILPETDPSKQSQWTLGTNFLGAYYSIFDMTYRQVGFAGLR